jgi:hypothetical protein
MGSFLIQAIAYDILATEKLLSGENHALLS